MAGSTNNEGTPVRSGQDMLPLVRNLETGGLSEDDAAKYVSRTGARGVYQVEPGTARQYGFDPDKLFDPEYNKTASTAILNDLWKRYRGDPEAMLVGYHAGPGAANRWLANNKQGGIGPQTLKYLNRASRYIKINGLPPSGVLVPSSAKDELSEGTPLNSGEQEPPVARGQADVQRLRDGGYSAADISQYQTDTTKTLLKGGYTPKEINGYWGINDADPKAIDEHIRQNLLAVPDDQAQKVGSNPLQMFGAGWNIGYGSSVSGLIANQSLPSGEQPQGFVQKTGAMAGQLYGDAPAMLLGAVGGAAAGGGSGAAAGGPAAPLTATAGAVGGAGAGAFALPAAMREIIMDYYKRGEVHSFADFAKMAGASVFQTAKAGVTGYMTAVTGGAAAGAAEPFVGKVAADAVNVAAQAATATTVGAAMEGHVPDADSALLSTVAMLGPAMAVHYVAGRPVPTPAAKKAAANMETIYRQTGVPPWKLAADAATDPIIKQEVLAEDVNGDPVFPKTRANASEEPPPFKQNEVTIHETPHTPEEDGAPPAVPPGGEPPEDALTPPGGRSPGIEHTPKLDEAMLNELASEFIGEPKRPDSWWTSLKDLWRQYVTELSPADKVDALLAKKGYDLKTRLGLADMLRQTYGSDERVHVMLRKGGLKLDINPDTGRAELMLRDDVPPLFDILDQVRASGGDLEGWRNYMVAQRSLDREALGDETGHPLTPQQRQDLINFGRDKYEAATKEFQKVTSGALEYGRDSGIFNQKQLDTWGERNPTYVSFRYLLGDKTIAELSKRPTKGKGFRVREPVRTFMGYDGQITDPVLATIDNMKQIVAMSDRNRAIGSFIALAEQNGVTEDLGLTRLAAPEVKATIAEPGSNTFAPYMPENVAAEVADPFLAIRAQRNGKLKDNQFIYIRNGVPEIWQATSPELAVLMRGADAPGQAEALSRLVFGFAKMQRAGIVNMTDFPVRNVMRDGIQSFIADPHSPPPFLTWVRGAMSVINKDEHFWNWMVNGGGGTALSEMDTTILERDLNGVFDQTGTWDKMWNVFQHPLEVMDAVRSLVDAMQRFHNFTDRAQRVGYFKQLTSDGLDPLKAGTNSRKAFLDFKESGTAAAARWMGRATPFFRPGLLGLKQLAEGATGDPMGFMLKSVAAVTLPKLALYAWNYWADQSLPDDQKYEQVPRWQRDTMYIFPAVNGVRIRLPMPPLLNVAFGGLPERFLDAWRKEDPNAFHDWAGSFASQVFPPVIPAAVLPIAEHFANRNVFTGKPLISDAMKGATGEMQYTENTTAPAKALSHIIGKLGVDLSPLVIENYVREWTGTGGMMAMKALNVPFNDNGKPWEITDIPFVQSFLIRNPGFSAQSIQDFYDQREEFTRAAVDKRLALKRMIEGGDNAAYELDRALAESQGNLDNIAEGLSMYRSVVVSTYHDKTMTNDEKRQFTDDMVSNMITISKTGSEIMKALKAK